MGRGVILEGSRANFDHLVLDNSRKGLVLVDFWSPKAGPSLRQREILRALADEYAGRFLLVTVDTEQERELIRRFGVTSIPSMRCFRHGRVVEAVRGMQPRSDYRHLLERHLPPPGDPARTEAARAWQNGQAEQAIQTLVEGAIEQPQNLAIPVMLVKFLMQLGRHREARQVLDALPSEAQQTTELAELRAHLDFILTAQRAPELETLRQVIESEPDDLEARFQLASAHMIADDYEAVLEQLREILRRQPGWQHKRVPRSLLAVIDVLGPDHELIRRHRNELARAIH